MPCRVRRSAKIQRHVWRLAVPALMLGVSIGPATAALTTTIALATDAHTDVLTEPRQTRVELVDGPVAGAVSTTVGVPGTAAHATARASAAANAGSLAVNAYARGAGRFDGAGTGPAVQALAQAEVSFKIDDLMFSGPSGTVAAALRMDISGMLEAATDPILLNTISNGTAEFDISVSLNVTPRQIGQRNHLSSENGGVPGTAIDTFLDSGPTAGVDFPATITFDSVLVPTNTPVTLDVLLEGHGAAILDSLGIGDGSAFGQSIFGTTVHFPIGSPAFVLPAGYSVQSTTASITDNRWLGTPVSAAPVPVPAMAWALAGVLAWLSRKGWRRSRSRCPHRRSGAFVEADKVALLFIRTLIPHQP